MEMHSKATDGVKSPDLVEVWGTLAAVGDPQLVIMDNTVECNRLRRLCRGHKGRSYPPQKCCEYFRTLTGGDAH